MTSNCLACGLNKRAAAGEPLDASASLLDGVAWSMACSRPGIVVDGLLCDEHRHRYAEQLADVRRLMASLRPGVPVKESSIPSHVQAAVYQESKRHIGAMVDFVKRWPEYRRAIAYAFLGAMIGEADTFGCDVEAFIAQLRRQGMTRQVAELHPPKATQS